MTEQINDQISAFIDDELSDEECSLLVRRFERDTDARGQAMRYTLIGAALRGELANPDHSLLCRRIASALDGAPRFAANAAPSVTQRRSALPRLQARVWRPLAGFGIAATVAVAAIVGLRSLNDGRSVVPVATVARDSSAPVPRAWTEPAAYTVPQDVSSPPVFDAPQIRLTNYLVRHGEYASGLSRTLVHSNVIGASDLVPASEQQDPDPSLE